MESKRFNDLPTLNYSRRPTPPPELREPKVVYGVNSAKRLGLEFDNRKATLKPSPSKIKDADAFDFTTLGAVILVIILLLLIWFFVGFQ